LTIVTKGVTKGEEKKERLGDQSVPCDEQNNKAAKPPSFPAALTAVEQTTTLDLSRHIDKPF
jgi:hypothetical protein